MNGRSRLALTVATAAVILLIGAIPAAALMTSNPTRCFATGTITDKAGKAITTTDQNAVEIKMPREGLVTWRAGIANLAKKYSGEFALDFDLFKFAPGAWKFKGGPQKDLTNKGAAKIPSVIKYIPPGKYKVAGFRTGDGQTCVGYATIVIEGSPFTSPTGIGLLAATVIALIAFVRSGFARVGP